eukprot:TRINITY_DN6930_c0_g1_i1.p1 TRINITY_DN6930_c0_g1~~TRINITY_DN6930_c0_g1_i1.p1  ORF type:complete len:368 (-),score=63.47 TRINITY_DN6930_c0_g1_i1:21-1124(-)
MSFSDDEYEADSLQVDHRLPTQPQPIPISEKINSLPSLLFDSPEEVQRGELLENAGSTLEDFSKSKSYTPVDGLARGITAFGHNLVSGVVGVFTEPVQGAMKGGASGFFSGIGKGFTGLFVKPVAGTVALAQKTTEGFINTPSTVIDVGQRLGKVEKPTRHFGLPLRESIDKAKKARRRHVLLHIIDYFRKEGKTVYGIFTKPFTEAQVLDWRDAIDDGYDLEFEGYNAHDVAGLFKLYFDMLPVPLIPRDVYEKLIRIAAGGQAASPELWKKVGPTLKVHLPSENASVLNEICLLMREIAADSVKNGMHMSQLASAMVYTLMRPHEDATHIEIAAARIVLQAIFAYYDPHYLTYRLLASIDDKIDS